MLKKVKKEGVGNQRLVGLTSVAGKVGKEILLGSIAKHTKDKKQWEVVSMDLEN